MTRMLDVLLGLVFVFTMFSLVASIVLEVLESFLRRRARDLEKGIDQLLGDTKLAGQLYEHPLIKALHAAKGRRPSYIPSETFAVAVLDLVGGVRAATKDATATIQLLPEDDKNPAAKAIRALALHAGGSLDELRHAVERWYDAAMDRVSALYRRQTQVTLLLLGAVLAGSLNVDAINIAQTLATDPEVRARVAGFADEWTRERGEAVPAPPAGGRTDQAVLPAAATVSPPVATRPLPPPASLDRLQAVGLPIGWVSGSDLDPRALPRDGWGRLKKIAGLLVTAFAITLGAPFWFDVLNRVTRLRSAVKPLPPISKGDAQPT